MKKKTIAILGSTGSIGQSALEIIKKSKEFDVKLLIANKNYLKIINQIKIFNPSIVVVNNKNIFLQVKKKLQNRSIIILNNITYITKYISEIDITVSAIPGIAGLEPTILFTKISKKILLANKEAIICGWHLIKKYSIKYKTELVPIDSEHFSINTLLKNYSNDQVEKIYITASGGPFLKLDIKKFKNIKPIDAIKHPKWNMGKKISVDSATLMNKVLEVTEALNLFPFNLNQYEIIIHPDSLIHAIIKLNNGTSLFLYHYPDMKIPIGNALLKDFNYRNFFNQKNKIYNKIQSLKFIPVDKKKFPVVSLIPIMNSRKSSAIIINAANEIFVDEFLKKKISFNDISAYLKLVLRDKSYIKTSNLTSDSIKKIYKIDNWARITALQIIEKKRLKNV
jgi:1-deoxy-D-xylulose-5-phosphate reductoisomerase